MLQLPAAYELYGIAAALGLALTAAITDWRKGEIPNWLTLPPLVVAPVVYGILLGKMGAIASVLGIIFCGLPTLVLWWQGGIGGGDVKLVAAIGATAGIMAGLEIELVAFVVAALYALGRLAWEGKLLRTLGNTLFLALNPLLPKKWRRKVSPSLMNTVRLGGAFLAATILSFLVRQPNLYS